MTAPQIKVRIVRRSQLKLKVLPKFPANVEADGFLVVQRVDGKYIFGVDYTKLDPSSFSDPANTFVVVLDAVSGSYKVATLSALIAGATQIEQHITGPGPVSIDNNTGIVRVDQATGAPITLNLPLSTAKTCPVLISDWKGDAGTNNITINLSGSDKFPGNLTSWKIAADTGSVFLRPIPGAGYAL